MQFKLRISLIAHYHARPLRRELSQKGGWKMDFSLAYSEEQEEFAGEVRAWMNEHIPSDLLHPRDALKMSREQWLMRREISRKLGEKGWLYPEYPSQYGGGGLGSALSAVLYREFAGKGLSIPPHYDSGRLTAPTLMVRGTDEQKKQMLPPILRGEVVTWQLFTEPEAGTDEANQQIDALRSVREKDYFVVNGGKIFVGGIYAPPDQFLLLTRSDPEAPRHQNLAMFIAPADLPGIQILPLDLFPTGTFGQTCYEAGDSAPGVKHSVFFDNVKINESFLIGGDHDGWQVANATLTVEHGDKSSTGTRKTGETIQGSPHIPRNLVVQRLLDHCKNDPRVKKRIEDNPHLLDTIVDIYIADQIDRLFLIRNADAAKRGVRMPYAGPQESLHLKMFGAELTAKMAKILGPYALTDDENWAMAEDIFEVTQRSGLCLAPGGTPEALKIVISRALRIGR